MDVLEILWDSKKAMQRDLCGTVTESVKTFHKDTGVWPTAISIYLTPVRPVDKAYPVDMVVDVSVDVEL